MGSTTAYALLLSQIPAEIVLIGRDQRRADGHVQDLRDAEVFAHSTKVVAGQFADCCSADVVIITAGMSQSGRTSKTGPIYCMVDRCDIEGSGFQRRAV